MNRKGEGRCIQDLPAQRISQVPESFDKNLLDIVGGVLNALITQHNLDPPSRGQDSCSSLQETSPSTLMMSFPSAR